LCYGSLVEQGCPAANHWRSISEEIRSPIFVACE